MTRFKLIPAILLICLTAMALIQIGGCANIVPPSGGPRDSIPPYAVYAKPKDSSTGIAPKEILISFNEYITTVQQQIKMVWDKIQQKDFYTGCGKEDCHWCNFVKNNELAVALHALEEEI